MSNVKDNNLKKNSDDWAISSLISNAKDNEHTILAWKIVAGKKITVDVAFHVIRKFKNEIDVRAIGDQAKKILGDLAVNAQKLNFYLPDDQVLFQTEVKKIQVNGNVTIQFPEMIAQIDRRKSLRLFLDEGLDLEIGFSKKNHSQNVLNQRFEKKCFDISSGGLSFLISRLEMNFFKRGDSIKGIQLNLDGAKLVLEGKVVNILEVEPNKHNGLIYKANKVCIELEKLNSSKKKQLESYVFHHVELEEVV